MRATLGRNAKNPPRLDFQDALCRQAGQRLVANVFALRGEVRHPEAGVLRGLGLGDVGEYGIEQVIVERPGVQQRQVVGVRVDAAFQGQVHQQGAGQRAGQGPLRDRDEVAPFVVHQEQQQFVGKSQHGFKPRSPTPAALARRRP